MKKILILLVFIIGFQLQAQEFKCKVTINATSVRGSNKQMFKTLQRAIEDFVNNTRWTDKRFQEHEKIKADIFLNVKEYDAKKGQVKAELYFRSYRPVFDSDYQTLLLNLIDKNFVFNYREFERLDFNLELYENNLVSTLAFYTYIALGYDFNSFKENAGKPFFEKAQIIQTNANQNNVKGWDNDNKNDSKGDMVEQLLNEESVYYHKAIYTYHRWGLDMMSKNIAQGKNNIISAINYLKKFKDQNKDASYLIKIFFDAKSDEIVQIFTSGPPVNKSFVVNKLRNLAPNYDFKWDEIQGKRGNFNQERGFGGPPRNRMPSKNIKEKFEKKERKK